MGLADEREAVQLQFARRFPEQVRRIMELALPRASELTTLFRFLDRTALQRFAISVLGQVGDERTIGLLEPYTNDPRLGDCAITSVRLLREGLRL